MLEAISKIASEIALAKSTAQKCTGCCRITSIILQIVLTCLKASRNGMSNMVNACQRKRLCAVVASSVNACQRLPRLCVVEGHVQICTVSGFECGVASHSFGIFGYGEPVLALEDNKSSSAFSSSAYSYATTLNHDFDCAVNMSAPSPRITPSAITNPIGAIMIFQEL